MPDTAAPTVSKEAAASPNIIPEVRRESDHSPFANNILTVKVPLNSQHDSHVTVKGEDALPPGDADPDIKNPGYKYTIVASSADGKVGVCDPTVIIR
jgi:hypothetical protein